MIIFVIITIGTTAPFEPRFSSEASASCPYSLQHSLHLLSPNFLASSISICQELDRFIKYSSTRKTFHEPILRSLNRFIGCHISDSPAIASSDFVTIFFSGAGCQPYIQPPAILEDRLDCFLVGIFVTDQSGMGIL